tara:strand:- start:170 stop:493 length:324 start_codon:yes stop_codon:yes gene_type:complete
MTQLSLDRAIAARDQALGIVDANADAEWKEAALNTVYEVAAIKRRFTADDVWEQIPAHFYTHEPRALGPVMMRAMRNGWIVATDTYVRCQRVSRHTAPIRVWESRLK